MFQFYFKFSNVKNQGFDQKQLSMTWYCKFYGFALRLESMSKNSHYHSPTSLETYTMATTVMLFVIFFSYQMTMFL